MAFEVEIVRIARAGSVNELVERTLFPSCFGCIRRDLQSGSGINQRISCDWSFIDDSRINVDAARRIKVPAYIPGNRAIENGERVGKEAIVLKSGEDALSRYFGLNVDLRDFAIAKVSKDCFVWAGYGLHDRRNMLEFHASSFRYKGSMLFKGMLSRASSQFCISSSR